MKQIFTTIWQYALNHDWSKDILRANFLYIILVILFNFCHFGLHPISWTIFFRMWLLLNLCQFFKALLDNIR